MVFNDLLLTSHRKDDPISVLLAPYKAVYGTRRHLHDTTACPDPRQRTKRKLVVLMEDWLLDNSSSEHLAAVHLSDSGVVEVGVLGHTVDRVLCGSW